MKTLAISMTHRTMNNPPAFIVALALLGFHACLNPGIAGEFNRVLSVGDQAPTWQDLPSVDGKPASMTDFSDAKTLVIVLTCNTCPYAVDVEDRLINLAQQWADRGAAVVAINANNTDEDSLDAMKERAKKKSFPFAYLKDESQEVAKAYGATRTPEFFVLDQERKLAYLGALDDSPDGKSVQKRYVEDAVQAVLDGTEPLVKETVPIGCNIRYARSRRGSR